MTFNNKHNAIPTINPILTQRDPDCRKKNIRVSSMANVSPFNQILGKCVRQFCVIVLTNELTNADEIINSLPVVGGSNINNNYVWYGIVEFNVPLDTV